MQKLVEIHQNKRIDMLQLGYNSFNLTNIRLRNSAGAKFCPITGENEESLSNVRENKIGASSLKFTGKTSVYVGRILKSKNVCLTDVWRSC